MSTAWGRMFISKLPATTSRSTRVARSARSNACLSRLPGRPRNAALVIDLAARRRSALTGTRRRCSWCHRAASK